MTNLSAKLQQLIAWLLITLVSILPFVFCWLTDELFEFNKMLVVYLFAVLCGGLFLARMIIERRLIWRRTVFDWPLGLFLLSQVISTLLSIHPRTSWLGYYTRLNGGLLSTISYTVLYYCFVNNIDRHSRRQFLISLFTSGALVSLYAILEHFGHSLSCLIIKGNFSVNCWVQDVQTRVFATFGQPNWLAAYNVTLIGLGTPLLTLLHSRTKNISTWTSPYLRWILPLSVYLNFIALIFTKSRSGSLAFFAGLIVTTISLIYLWRQRSHAQFSQRLRFFSLILLGFIIPALIWGTQYTPSLSQLLRSASAQTLEMGIPAHLAHIDTKITDSADIRRIVWRGALDIWRDFPIFGTGVETFAYTYYLYRPTDHNWTSEWDFLYNKAHNELLNLAANSGTFGLLTYLAIFVTLAWITIRSLFYPRRLDHNVQQTTILIGVSSGLLALSITNFFGFSTVTVQVLLFLLLALAAQVYQPQPITPLNHTLTLTWQKVTLTLLTFFSLYLLNQVWLTWYADYNYAKCKALVSRIDAGTALNYCQLAVRLRPQEALYQIELGDFYAQLAVALARQDASASATVNTLANQSLELSDHGLHLNTHNLNFYKTRFRTLTNLGQLDPHALDLAQENLDIAMLLSPTDPKLTYYAYTLAQSLGQTATASAYLDQTLTLRPLYHEARLAAARQAQANGDLDTALAHYHYLLSFIDSADVTALQAVSDLATVSGIITP